MGVVFAADLKTAVRGLNEIKQVELVEKTTGRHEQCVA
jgi:hypothetical protein